MARPYSPACVEIKKHFETSRDELKSVTESLANSSSKTTASNNYLYRSQIIMAYSAFDLFMHELLYLAFQKMRQQKLVPTEEFLYTFAKIPSTDDAEFTKILKEKYGQITLTSKDWGKALYWMGLSKNKIAKSFLMKYDLTAYEGDKDHPFDTLRDILREKTQRRNKLVHAYDYTIPGGIQEPINQKIAGKYTSFISDLVGVVYDCADKAWN